MDMQKTGSFIAERRKLLSITQKNLGDQLCVTDKAVSKWERGIACPDINLIGKLAVILNCSITEIMNGRADKVTDSSSIGVPEASAEDDQAHAADPVEVVFDHNNTRYVSPYLFGSNLEHTHSAVNGGLSAQMLKNRKFVGKPGGYYGCAEKWFPIGENAWIGFAEAYTRHYEGYHMRRQYERNSQKITNDTPGSVCGIGQHELYLKKDTDYAFRIAVKTTAPVTLTVALTDRHGKVYSDTTLRLESADFSLLETTIHSPSEDRDADLRITFSDVCTVTIGAVSLMPADNFHGMRADVVALLRSLGLRLLRWPGGNFAGDYYWKDGLLPVDMRSPLEAYWRLETQPHTNGYDFHEINTDDFIALCREIGAEPYITLNPAWNTPEESAQWVEYCNGAEDTEYGKLRAQNGHPAPYNVQFWSLGNEFGYGHMEGDNTPYGYKKTAEAHANAILKISPHLVLCSSGPHPNMEWIDHVVKPLEGTVQLVSLHCYPFYPLFEEPEKQQEEYYHFISLPDTQAGALAREMRTKMGNSKVGISYDEWNAWYSWYRPISVCEGIFTARMVHMLLRHSEPDDIQIACQFQAVNEGFLHVESDRAFLTPDGQVMTLMKHHANGICLVLERDIAATEKDGIITVTLINGSYDTEKSFRFPCTGKIKKTVLLSGEKLTPPSAFTVSDGSYSASDGNIAIILPPHSVMLVQMEVNT